jgi:hypothetical protein
LFIQKSVHVRCPCKPHAQPPSWRTTACQLSTTVYSIYSQLPFISSRDSSVGVATSYGLDDGGGRSSSPGKVKNVLFFTSSRPGLEFIQPLIQWVPGTISLRVNRPGRETDHSPPASVEVKKMWNYISTPHTPS